jgi:hypothetical protein
MEINQFEDNLKWWWPGLHGLARINAGNQQPDAEFAR